MDDSEREKHLNEMNLEDNTLKAINEKNAEHKRPLSEERSANIFHVTANDMRNASTTNDAMLIITRYMYEQAIYMEHIRDHIQSLMNHTAVLTERLVGLQNEVRAAMRTEQPAPTATTTDGEKQKQKIH